VAGDGQVDDRVAEKLEPFVRTAGISDLVDVRAVQKRTLEDIGSDPKTELLRQLLDRSLLHRGPIPLSDSSRTAESPLYRLP
jgi:hypothetical protein